MPVEVRLVLMLCRYPADRIDAQVTASLCSQIDSKQPGEKSDRADGGWEFFLQVAAHHRVLPIVAANARLLNLPPAIIQHLHAYASRNAIEAFRSLTETKRLLKSLDSVEIHACVLKGVALSLQAYGDVATRDVGDIDLLIRPEQTSEADALLQQNGYVRKDPRGKLTPRRRASYARHFKDYTYEPLAMEAQGGFEVDLHWRLFRSQLMPGNELTQVETVSLSAGSFEITTLSHPAHLLYLAIQGALDGWTRFKSVADIAALWNGCDKADVLELAREAGVLPYLFAALALAEHWIGGIELPQDFAWRKFSSTLLRDELRNMRSRPCPTQHFFRRRAKLQAGR